MTIRRMTEVTAIAVACSCGCGEGGGSAADVAARDVVEDGGLPDPAPGDDDIPSELTGNDPTQEVTRDAPFDPAAWCPSGTPIPAPAGLIPAPTSVLAWGEEVPVATVSARGADEVEAAEVAAMAAARGLEVVDDGALRIEFHPADEWTVLADTCPLDRGHGAYYLAVVRDAQGAVASVFAPDAAGRFHALKTLKQMIRRGDPPAVRVATILDRPGAPVRGVIEGFYGEPWTREARLAVIPLMADLKLNFFAYAPKGDWGISALWKAPLAEEDAERIREVVEVASRNRVRVCWEVRPVLLLVFSSQEDFEAILAKFRAIASNGADCLILAFDDTEKFFYDEDQQVYDSYIEGLVDFANRLGTALRAEMPEALFVFVPRDYWLNAPDAATDLAYLGANLDPVWEVAWTGNEIVSATITGTDAEAYAAVVHRTPFLGDNFPVTDDATKTGVLNLGPLTGRTPDLPARVSGIAYNASPLPFASLLGIATGADFAWNPQAYDPARSLRAASLWLAGDQAAWAVEVLGQTNQIPPFSVSAAPVLDEAIRAYWLEFEAGQPSGTAATALAAIFTDFLTVPAALDSPEVHAGFASEVRPWAVETGAWGEAGLAALDLLAVVAAGGVADPDQVAALAARYDALVAATPRPTGDAMPAFIARALEVLSP